MLYSRAIITSTQDRERKCQIAECRVRQATCASSWAAQFCASTSINVRFITLYTPLVRCTPAVGVLLPADQRSAYGLHVTIGMYSALIKVVLPNLWTQCRISFQKFNASKYDRFICLIFFFNIFCYWWFCLCFFWYISSLNWTASSCSSSASSCLWGSGSFNWGDAGSCSCLCCPKSPNCQTGLPLLLLLPQ